MTEGDVDYGQRGPFQEADQTDISDRCGQAIDLFSKWCTACGSVAVQREKEIQIVCVCGRGVNRSNWGGGGGGSKNKGSEANYTQIITLRKVRVQTLTCQTMCGKRH